MLALVAFTVLAAAPRLDGVYVEPSTAAFLTAPALSPGELSWVEYVAFSKTEVTFRFVMESDKQKWAPAADGLVIAGATVAWKQRADGVIETGLERWPQLVFVKGDFEARVRAAKDKFQRTQLTRLAGKYGAVEVDAQGLRVEGKRVAVDVYPCIPDCGTEFLSICIGARDVVWIERDEGLLQVADTRELCGMNTGIHTEGGKLLPRSSMVDAAQLEAAINARAPDACLAKRPATMSVTIEPSGMISAVRAGEATNCLSTVLAKLVFPPQPRPIVVTLTR